jgi:hypothetical protein
MTEGPRVISNRRSLRVVHLTAAEIRVLARQATHRTLAAIDEELGTAWQCWARGRVPWSVVPQLQCDLLASPKLLTEFTTLAASVAIVAI